MFCPVELTDLFPTAAVCCVYFALNFVLSILINSILTLLPSIVSLLLEHLLLNMYTKEVKGNFVNIYTTYSRGSEDLLTISLWASFTNIIRGKLKFLGSLLLPTYHMPFIILVTSKVTVELFCFLRHQSLGVTATSASPIAAPLNMIVYVLAPIY